MNGRLKERKIKYMSCHVNLNIVNLRAYFSTCNYDIMVILHSIKAIMCNLGFFFISVNLEGWCKTK